MIKPTVVATRTVAVLQGSAHILLATSEEYRDSKTSPGISKPKTKNRILCRRLDLANVQLSQHGGVSDYCKRSEKIPSSLVEL